MANKEAAEKAVRDLLIALDQDVESVDMKGTPERVARMYIAQCVKSDAGLERTFQTDKLNDLIMARNIPVQSYCPHHLVPWYGRAHVAYIPHEKVLGVSKLARLVYSCTRGFPLQEEVTKNIADKLYEELDTKGVMVVIEAVHTCMALRGAKALGASVTTSAVRGVMRDVIAAREEVLTLIAKGGPV